jgi:uncharacterized protein (TIGR02266 family)
MVQELGQRVAAAGTSSRNVDVALDGTSTSNFFTDLDGSHGGVFVGTYAKPPPLGARVAVHVALPGNARFEAEGTVAWIQDGLGEDGAAGFGVRFVTIPDVARALITEFVRLRQPLVRE